MDWPSIVMLISAGGEGAVAIIYVRAGSGPDSYTLRFGVPRGMGETDTAGTLPFQNVRVDFGPKMFQYRLNGRGNDLAQAANGREAHRLRELIEECEVSAIL